MTTPGANTSGLHPVITTSWPRVNGHLPKCFYLSEMEPTEPTEEPTEQEQEQTASFFVEADEVCALKNSHAIFIAVVRSPLFSFNRVPQVLKLITSFSDASASKWTSCGRGRHCGSS